MHTCDILTRITNIIFFSTPNNSDEPLKPTTSSISHILLFPKIEESAEVQQNPTCLHYNEQRGASLVRDILQLGLVVYFRYILAWATLIPPVRKGGGPSTRALRGSNSFVTTLERYFGLGYVLPFRNYIGSSYLHLFLQSGTTPFHCWQWYIATSH
jgi:hypothetical protein